MMSTPMNDLDENHQDHLRAAIYQEIISCQNKGDPCIVTKHAIKNIKMHKQITMKDIHRERSRFAHYYKKYDQTYLESGPKAKDLYEKDKANLRQLLGFPDAGGIAD